MRIKLLKGKQRELIEKAKRNLSWDELSKRLNLCSTYIRNELRKEERLISENHYKKLCNLSGENFDKEIIKKLDDYWGRSKGGRNSRGSTINLKVSNNKIALAELIGIILGDGNINLYKKGKKVGVYQTKIAGHYKKDKEYHLNYIKPLCKSLFNLKVKESIDPKDNERFLFLSSKELIEFFKKHGLEPGNKITNQLTIPKWIFKKEPYLKVCLRGLIDTDGSVFRMSKEDPKLIRINFVNLNHTLLKDTRRAFIKLGFHPSKIIQKRVFYLSRKSDIERYLRDIGFSNPKHINRLQEFKNSPVV